MNVTLRLNFYASLRSVQLLKIKTINTQLRQFGYL